LEFLSGIEVVLEFARRVVSLDHMLTGGRGNSKIIPCGDGSARHRGWLRSGTPSYRWER